MNFELGPGELVSEVDDLELAGVDGEDCANEDVLELQLGVLAALEEDALVLEVELHRHALTISMDLSLRK